MDYSYRYFQNLASKTELGTSPVGVTMVVVDYVTKTFKSNPKIVEYAKNIPFTIKNMQDFQKFDDEINNLKGDPEIVDVNDDVPIVAKEKKTKAVRVKSFKKTTESYKIDMTHLKGENYSDHFQKITPSILKRITKILDAEGSIKLSLQYNGIWHKPIKKIDQPFFLQTTQNADPVILTKASNKEKAVSSLIEVLTDQVEIYILAGSDVRFKSSTALYLQVARWRPRRGGSYIPSPDWIVKKRCCINVTNYDNQCFKWAITAALNPKEKNAERVQQYIEHSKAINWKGINFPASYKDFNKFEKNNDISLNVFEIGKKLNDVTVLYITDKEKDTHIDLGLISSTNEQNETTHHYVWIKNFSAFNQPSKDTHKLHYCKRCLHGFKEEATLLKHKPDCYKHASTKIEMPNDSNKYIEFKNVVGQLKSPFVVYADFECILLKNGEHVPDGFTYVICSEYESYKFKLENYTGKDCMEVFFKRINNDMWDIYKILKTYKPLKLSPQETTQFKSSATCCLCKNPFKCSKDKHRDHDHISGKYRGAACQTCNINFNLKNWKLPVFFHNLRGYDSHLILSASKHAKGNITCIPNNMEKYMEFEIGKLKFLDSLQFMGSSLATLVENLAKGGLSQFPNTKKYWKDEKLVEYVTRKGVYPYEYMDDFKRFKEKKLPAKEAFYSSLTGEHVKDEEYEYAQKIWKVFKCKTIEDYHDLYLKTDVLLLADVFENFRKVCYDACGLDPSNFITAPSLAWNAMLKLTRVKLECLTDINVHLMVEKGIRGGMCMVVKRHAAANNKYMPDYDPKKPDYYLMYLDANNLYGWAMIQSLPTGNYQWENPEKWAEASILNYKEDSEHGYILEVDLEYPHHLHDLHNDYPLAPESTCFAASPYMQQLMKANKVKPSSTDKLIPNLEHKRNYVVHIRNLKMYLELGMNLTRIHRIIKFDQSPWLKEYIDFNTDKRKVAKNDFEKDFWKLMNNSVFGKFMENVRHRVDIKLETTREGAQKHLNKPTLKRWKEFNNDLIGIELRKRKTVLNKPIAIGFCILDLSKTLMYDFHYNYIKKEYGDKAKLLYTDTDSLVYHIRTTDIYQDMKQHKEKYDFSEYPATHPCQDKANAKVIGKMKDEVQGRIIYEFIGLRPKLYSVLIQKTAQELEEDNRNLHKNMKKAKGKEVMHERYHTRKL